MRLFDNPMVQMYLEEPISGFPLERFIKTMMFLAGNAELPFSPEALRQLITVHPPRESDSWGVYLNRLYQMHAGIK